MTRIVAYCRVSTTNQADNGVSIEAQRAKVEAYALALDLDVVAVEVDIASAKTLAGRPALDRALGLLRSGHADALLVVKLDRLTRSVRDLCDLVDRYFRDGRWSLMSVGENIDTRSAAGRMLLNMLTVIGQWEREAIGERTSAALQHLKSQGKRVSRHAPYGFTFAGDAIVPVDHEQAVIVEAKSLRAAGMSLRDVAGTLAARGLVSRTGKPFTPSAVSAMVA